MHVSYAGITFKVFDTIILLKKIKGSKSCNIYQMYLPLLPTHHYVVMIWYTEFAIFSCCKVIVDKTKLKLYRLDLKQEIYVF